MSFGADGSDDETAIFNSLKPNRSGVQIYLVSLTETVHAGQFKWGIFLLKSNGGVYQGWLSPDGNRAGRVKAEASLTARLTSHADAKAELSDPTILYRKVGDNG